MTDNQAAVLKEIKLYYERMGRYPSVTSLAYIMKKAQPTMTLTIQRMVKRGYLKYVGNWTNGQSRQVGINPTS